MPDTGLDAQWTLSWILAATWWPQYCAHCVDQGTQICLRLSKDVEEQGLNSTSLAPVSKSFSLEHTGGTLASPPVPPYPNPTEGNLFPLPLQWLIHEQTNKFMICKEFCSSALLRYASVQSTVFLHPRFSGTLPISCNVIILNKFILFMTKHEFILRYFMYTNSETRKEIFFSDAMLWCLRQKMHSLYDGHTKPLTRSW